MAINDKARKSLWGRSGNKCAICKTELVHEKDPYDKTLNIGEECHMISSKSNGPRFIAFDSFDYDSCDNLLLLCCNHHKTIDEKIEEYPIEKLKEIKITHEKWVKEKLNSPDIKPNQINSNPSIIDFVFNKYNSEMGNSENSRILDSHEGYSKMIKEMEDINEYGRNIIEQIKAKTPKYSISIRENTQGYV